MVDMITEKETNLTPYQIPCAVSQNTQQPPLIRTISPQPTLFSPLLRIARTDGSRQMTRSNLHGSFHATGRRAAGTDSASFIPRACLVLIGIASIRFLTFRQAEGAAS
jgi:hypothetical protein